MPYPLSLQAYTPPEFYKVPPVEWERRLKEIAPEMPGLDHLVFRCFDPTNPDGEDRGWLHNERPIWTLYSAKPIRMVEKTRAKQFEKHWSELHESEQAGRQSVVSDYQHFMWHSQGLYVNPFLILQGPWGGTPMKYTEAEVAFLEASDCFAEPWPIGSFPACPFDERVVEMIAKRNRLLQVANDRDALAKLDTPEAMKRTTEEAQLIKRQTYLDTWRQMIQPSVEFYASFVRTKEAARVLPKAPEGTARNVAMWRDHWLQHGSILGAGPAHQRQVPIAVK